MSGDGVAWRALPVRPGLLYEGPTWVADAQAFQWVDILRPSIHRWSPAADGDVETRDLDLEFATVALALDGDRSLVASRDSIHEYRWSTGSLRTVGQWDFEPDIRFNDGSLSPSGTVYIGTMSMVERSGAGALYRFADSVLETVVSNVTISNGLVWESDSVAFYVDSGAREVSRLSWADSGSDVVIDRIATYASDDGAPDGLEWDGHGNLLCAVWDGSRVDRWSTGGELLESIPTPGVRPTSVAIGEGYMLLTTASHASEESGDARPGAVFVRSRLDDR